MHSSIFIILLCALVGSITAINNAQDYDSSIETSIEHLFSLWTLPCSE